MVQVTCASVLSASEVHFVISQPRPVLANHVRIRLYAMTTLEIGMRKLFFLFENLREYIL